MHTVKAYVKDIQEFELFNFTHFEQSSIDQVAYPQIRSWIVFLADQSISNASINRKISSLKSYYKFLLRIKQIEQSPLLKHKALKNPGRVMVMRLIEELGTCDKYSEIIGVIDFGKDGSIEREQFKTILEKSPKLKNYTFDPIELLDKGYTKSKESRHTQLTINDFDFFKLGDFD